MQNRIDFVRPDAPVLAQRGPHPVGVRTLKLVNPSQPDVLAGGVKDRVLVVELWYPAVAETMAGPRLCCMAGPRAMRWRVRASSLW
jgi:hypothetical protein